MATVKDLGIVSPVPNGNWIASQSYQKLSIVRSGNSTYIAKTTNSGIQPGVTSGWESYWMLLNEDGGIGEPGPQGIPGEGVPTGGMSGQVLAKESNDNYDAKWIPQSQIAAGSATNDGSGNNIEQTYETKADSEAKRTQLQGQITENKNNISSNTESINRLKEIDSAVLKRLSNLENGIVPSPFVTDSTVAYIKAVPSNALSYALLQKVGGMSYAGDFVGLRSAAVTEVESRGANLVINDYYDKSQTKNGVAFTVHDDGTVTANGTTTASTDFYFRYTTSHLLRLEKGKTYTISGCPSGGDTAGYRLMAQDRTFNQEEKDYGSGKTFTAEYTDYYMIIRIGNGVTLNNITFKPMLVEGSKVLPFEPYKVLANFPIPDTVQSLEGYGLGVNANHYNHISWDEDGRAYWNVMVKRKIFDGTETFSFGESGEFRCGGITAISNSNTVNCICNHYAATTRSQLIDTATIDNLSASATFIRWRDSEVTTVAEMKAKLKAWYDAGNPLTVDYIIATPEVTDISDLITLDNIIEVTGNGVIEFKNQYNLAPASTVIYQTKEEAV